MQKQIEGFCRQITDAYDFDDIREELHGHIEDKLLDYLSGEEKLTEDDAFVLVRNHFGNPDNIKELLQKVHGREVKGSLARRIGAVLVATAAVEILISLRMHVVDLMKYIDRFLFSISRDFAGNTNFPFHPLSFFTQWFGLIGISLLLWIVLVRWQRKADIGSVPWFQRVKPVVFVALLVGFLMLQMVDPLFQSMQHAENGFDARRPHHISHPIKPDISIRHYARVFRNSIFFGFRNPFRFRDGYVLVYFILQLLAWLWWCDMPQRRFKSHVYTLGVWSGYWVILPLFTPMSIFYFNKITHQINLKFLWRFDYRFFAIFIELYGLAMICFLAFGLIVMSIYLLLTKFRIMEPRTGLLELNGKLA